MTDNPEQFLTAADLAANWFNPENADALSKEHHKYLGALINRPPKDPLVVGSVKRLREGDPSFAEWVVEQTLESAQKDYSAAIDSLTGLKSHGEAERWKRSVFRSIGPEEKRHTPERTLSPRTYTKVKGDLDNFKKINDLLGMHIGDAVLVAAAREIEASLRKGDNLVLFREKDAGDEFGIAAVDFTPEEAKALWKRLQRDQLKKIDDHRNQQIWAEIRDAIALYRGDNDYKETIRIESSVICIDGEDMRVPRRKLIVCGKVICNLSELAIIDFGYSHDLVKTRDDIECVDNAADRHKQAVKEMTHTAVEEAYRPNAL